jgi:hypothetical protein
MELPPLPTQPPIINGMWAAYIGIIATILIGIFFTRDDKRNFENILSNLVSFALLLATIQFTWLLLLFMVFYLLVGAIVAVEKLRNWFFLFGAKTYGPLALMVLLVYDNRLPIGFDLREIDFPVTTAVLVRIGYIFIGWFMMSLLVNMVAYFYWRTPSPKKKEGKAGAKAKASGLKARLFNRTPSKKGEASGRRRRTGRRR